MYTHKYDIIDMGNQVLPLCFCTQLRSLRQLNSSLYDWSCTGVNCNKNYKQSMIYIKNSFSILYYEIRPWVSLPLYLHVAGKIVLNYLIHLVNPQNHSMLNWYIYYYRVTWMYNTFRTTAAHNLHLKSNEWAREDDSLSPNTSWIFANFEYFS